MLGHAQCTAVGVLMCVQYHIGSSTRFDASNVTFERYALSYTVLSRERTLLNTSSVLSSAPKD